MKTRKNKNTLKKRRKTIKGGIASNTQAHIIVTKSKLDDKHQNLLYKLLIEGPTLSFLDYLNHNMDLVDEGLLAIKSKDMMNDESKEKDDIVYINTIEYGNNKPDNMDGRIIQKEEETKKEAKEKQIKLTTNNERYDLEEDLSKSKQENKDLLAKNEQLTENEKQAKQAKKQKEPKEGRTLQNGIPNRPGIR